MCLCARQTLIFAPQLLEQHPTADQTQKLAAKTRYETVYFSLGCLHPCQCLHCRDWLEQHLCPHLRAVLLPEPQSHFGSALDLSQPAPPSLCTWMCSMGYWSGGWLSLDNCSATSLLPPPGTSQQPPSGYDTRSSGNPSTTRGWYDPSTTFALIYLWRMLIIILWSSKYVFSPFLFLLCLDTHCLTHCSVHVLGFSRRQLWVNMEVAWLPLLRRWKKYFAMIANSHNLLRIFCFSEEVLFFQLVAVSDPRQVSHCSMWFF